MSKSPENESGNIWWMCEVRPGGPPTVRHQNRESAEAEAIRLVQKTGYPTFVLEVREVAVFRSMFQIQRMEFTKHEPL